MCALEFRNGFLTKKILGHLFATLSETN